MILALGLAYQDERCDDGWPMAPGPSPDGGADDPASSIRTSDTEDAWWQAGNRNGLQLYRELEAQGYRGSSKAMYRYLERLRTPQGHSVRLSSPAKFERAQECPGFAHATGKLLGTAWHLAVCVSPREARPDTTTRTGVDQAS